MIIFSWLSIFEKLKAINDYREFITAHNKEAWSKQHCFCAAFRYLFSMSGGLYLLSWLELTGRVISEGKVPSVVSNCVVTLLCCIEQNKVALFIRHWLIYDCNKRAIIISHSSVNLVKRSVYITKSTVCIVCTLILANRSDLF